MRSQYPNVNIALEWASVLEDLLPMSYRIVVELALIFPHVALMGHEEHRSEAALGAVDEPMKMVWLFCSETNVDRALLGLKVMPELLDDRGRVGAAQDGQWHARF